MSRQKANINRGDTVTVEYKEDEDTILVTPPKAWKEKELGSGEKIERQTN